MKKKLYIKVTKYTLVILALVVIFFKIEEISSIISSAKAHIFSIIRRPDQSVSIDISDYQPMIDEPDAWYSRNSLIAHACGGIDGRTYTNSKEAIENAISNGYNIIETDLTITDGGNIICYHSWDYSISYQEFMNKKVNYLYSPMNLDMLFNYLVDNPSLYCVTDMKCLYGEIDTQIIQGIVDYATSNHLEHILNQFIIQIYYEDDLAKVNSIYPFNNIIYTQYMNESDDASRIIAFCIDNNIHAVALSKESIDNSDIISMYNSKNIKVFSFTVNDFDEAIDQNKIGVTGFYTDFIRPKDLIAIGIN